MFTETKSRLKRALWAVLPFLAACGGGEALEPEPAAEVVSEASPLVLGANRYGLVSGGIYNTGAQALNDTTARNKFFCEMKQLNAKWLRIEADWWTAPSHDTYRRIVADAHANGLKVLVLYTHPQFCGDPASGVDRDNYINGYLDKVKWWTANVFNGTTLNGWSTKADAIEVMNEPNLEEECSPGVRRFRVEPNTFAWTLRRVYEWKKTSARTELIVSGGVLNTYTTESFWPALFNSGALINYKGSPPWDYFGIHPYNPWSYDWTCVNNLGTTSACFGTTTTGYKANVTNGLKTVRGKLNTATGVTNVRLFVTEFGFQERGSVTGPDNSVRNEAQVAEALRISAEAFGDSGVVDYALWYTYRNHGDGSGNFGLRTYFNGSTHYPSKWEPWHEFQKLSKGLTARTADSPDACWL